MRPALRSVARASLLAFICLIGSAVWAQQSERFKMKRLSITTVAEESVSSRFKTTVTASDVTGSAGVCPSGITTTAGFLALEGTGGVPIVLTADVNEAVLDDVDLDWTGQASQFSVYRSTSPANIIAPENLFGITMACGDTDSNAVGFNVLYYKVIESN